MVKDVKDIPISEVIDALLDTSKPFPPRYHRRFSDLNEEDLEALKAEWLNVLPERRIALMQDLEELQEVETVVNFEELAEYALLDPEARIRSTAAGMLWDSEDTHLILTFIRMLDKDPEETVRAAAASALGKFVWLGEMEEISTDRLEMIENRLLLTLMDKNPDLIRRRALEALGYSSREEVPEQIEKAFNNPGAGWKVSALFAMGRSADQAWESHVLKSLDNQDPEIRLEAVRAAGELELKSAREPIMEMLEEGVDDDGLRDTAIWSLSQIGGENVRALLEHLHEEMESDEDVSYLEEALDNLDFTEGRGFADLMDVEEVDEDDLDSLVDLNEEGDEPDQPSGKKKE